MSTAERKAVIKHADMNEEMQQDAIDCANVALEKFNIEKDIAAYIKKEFDKKYNPTWHCVVGRNFGSYVTHETKHFIYFYMGQVAILLFKSGWAFTYVIFINLLIIRLIYCIFAFYQISGDIFVNSSYDKTLPSKWNSLEFIFMMIFLFKNDYHR